MSERLTNQEAFDQGVSYIFKHGRSIDVCTLDCFYRGGGKLKCFAGALIPDEDYDRSMEGLAIDNIIGSIPSLRDVKVSLLLAGQKIHDGEAPASWKKCYRELAEGNNLEWKFEDTPVKGVDDQHEDLA